MPKEINKHMREGACQLAGKQLPIRNGKEYNRDPKVDNVMPTGILNKTVHKPKRFIEPVSTTSI